MKERLLKIGVTLFLIAIVVCAGALDVFPEKSKAAAGVLYNIEILNTATPFDPSKPTENNESPFVTYQVAPNLKEIPAPIVSYQEGITFQMLVGTKAKTEKLKTGPASYYPVTIYSKTYKDPGAHYAIPYGGETLDGMISTTMVKDALGKLYVSGGDVDVKNVQAEKKQTQTIGDGTTDPAGSLIIPIMIINRKYEVVDKGVTTANEAKWVATMTTGQSSTLIKGSKSILEGKTIPDFDTSGMLPKPMVGAPIDLAAGTGTLVATDCSMNVFVMMTGKVDWPRAYVWKMMIWPNKSTKPAYPTPTTTAETTTPSGSTEGSTAAIHTGLDINSNIGDLVANKDTAAVLEKWVPGFTTRSGLSAAYGYTLEFIAPYDKKNLTPEVLAGIAKDLAAIK